jgi:subtilisin family serine protease
MKKLTNIVRYSAYVVFLMASGCTADPEFENANDSNNNAPATRAQSDGKFYYAFDEKVPLYETSGRFVVTFDKEHRAGVEEHIMQNAKISKEELLIREGYSSDYAVLTTTDGLDKEAFSEELSKQAGIRSVRQVYALDDGYEMGYTNEVILQFKNDASQQKIDEMHKKFNVEVITTTELYVLLSVPAEFDPLDVANAYQESGLTNYSHPSFITTIGFSQSLPTDPYFNNQFYLRNTGQGVNGRTSTAGADINVVPAWNITKGSPNIVVAVIDQGVTSNHPDLPNSRQVRLSGSNFAGGNANDPSPIGNENHGNACAGIIGATHNNGQGIAGVAPNCKILPIRMGGSISDIANAIKLAANNADILSCSWELLDNNHNSSSNSTLYPVVVDAIRYATTSGKRGSKGSIVVFAAGNTANHVAGNHGFITFPANVNISGVLTVGAVDRNGQQAVYSPSSNPGSLQNQTIDVVAPSHKAYSSQISTETFDVWSIDIPGTAGYNYVHDTDSQYGGVLPIVGSFLPSSGTNYMAYTGHFGGTSAAAPQVAGIAALMLSVNPDLTRQQVADFITSTASNTSWNIQTGWGLVNAHAAVSAAIGQSLVNMSITGPDSPSYNTNVTYSVPATLPPGVTFNNWKVTPLTYNTTGGINNRNLAIKFTSSGRYTLTANYTLPDNTAHSVSRTVNVSGPLAKPSISWDKYVVCPGETLTCTVDNPNSYAVYDWELDGTVWVSGWGPDRPLLVQHYYLDSDSGLSKIRCRARNVSEVSEWSNQIWVYVSDTPL